VSDQGSSVRAACTDQVYRSLARTTLLGIPASTLLVLILGKSVPPTSRIGFVASVACADIIMFVIARRHLSARQRDARVPPPWLGASGVALIGAAWGALAVYGLPNANHVELRPVYLIFVCGTSATYVVGAAARRLFYFSSQLPMLMLITLGFATSGDRATRLLAGAVPVYFLVMTLMHNDVHQLVISELNLRAANDQATQQLQQANTQLAKQALRDELTGLANRAEFMKHLDAAVATARQQGATIAVLYLDLDRFKVVNDSLGHGGGDALLVAVSERIRSVTRTRDLVARLGGDEFTVLLEGLHHSGEPFAIAQRIHGVFERPFNVDGRSIYVTASIGVATNLYTTDDAESLLTHADAAQYQAKEAGRNRIDVFDVRMREAIQRRLGDEQEIRSALRTGEIVTWYQPEIDIATGTFTGAEALARWSHPERGILSAASFIEIANEAGLTYALDDAIIGAAVRARVDLERRDPKLDDAFKVWCNVGDDQLTRAQPAARLEDLLRRTECEPRHIGIEVTETAALSDLAAVARETAAARELGVQVALDDFGTGHSSLTILRSLPIDRVKIDRSFIKDITNEPRDAAIVANLIKMATDMGMQVVAEGVESPEQARKLIELGCSRAQGYLWSKAIPFDELERRLAQQHESTPVTPIHARSGAAMTSYNQLRETFPS
jgi:diguanylate cyclase (GGDEF)-like protein